MDAVYIVRPGDDNPELRWSLRSLVARWPSLDRVWVVGSCPSWVTGVEHIPGNRFSTKPLNVFDNVRLAVEHDDMPEDFVLMNDDFFLLTEVENFPVLYRGSLDAHIAMQKKDGWWTQSLRNTLEFLQAQGVAAPLSYDLHVPLPVNKAAMRDALAAASTWTPENPPQWRTVYGNLAGIGGERGRDVKCTQPEKWDDTQTMVSTIDRAFADTPVGTRIRATLRRPCRFEVK